MTSFTLADVQERTYKKRDAWWTVFLVDPLAGRLVVWTANHTSITPNQLTLGAGLLGLASAACFAMAEWQWLVAGALLFHLSFVLDCMDGKIARLKGTGSVFGAWVDFVFDRIRFFVCMMALLIGQWMYTGELVYLLLAPLLTFFDLLRYLNGPQMGKIRRSMRRQLRAAVAGETERPEVEDAESTEVNPPAETEAEAAEGETDSEDEENSGYRDSGLQPAAARQVVFVEEILRENPQLTATEVRGMVAGNNGNGDGETHVIDIHGGFFQKFSWYARVRLFLLRHRVRPHLFSGIEFEMFVCVVAPLTAVVSLFTPWNSLIVPVAVFSSAALMLFETILVYKLWLATRSFNEEMRILTGE
ncbi:CDP-alcohol phosphatidyltransferase family protein [Thermobifida halotolerans]|uniref:CDP-alcohol phosphatidyltransferase family protein n=1 Tax=Thermobifida halotolerans TaxID=483545 RepID=A0A399G4V8_9ACTN|nr:CDP-alcohol phosphatidyltransferase family protein [Thermobifida halotolerans]UOE18163.1 CDP-alcohol phosphatidyltransferase family protein [Thermobifida halotolerans]